MQIQFQITYNCLFHYYINTLVILILDIFCFAVAGAIVFVGLDTRECNGVTVDIVVGWGYMLQAEIDIENLSQLSTK